MKNMAVFKWSESKAVHLPEVDAEHRSLFQLAADFQAALEKHAPQSTLDKLVDALFQEAEDHFTHEERMMRAARYSLLQWHKSQHDTMRKNGKALAKRIRKGDREAGQELLQVLAHWLRDHMSVADNMMAASIRNHHRGHAA